MTPNDLKNWFTDIKLHAKSLNIIYTTSKTPAYSQKHKNSHNKIINAIKNLVPSFFFHTNFFLFPLPFFCSFLFCCCFCFCYFFLPSSFHSCVQSYTAKAKATTQKSCKWKQTPPPFFHTASSSTTFFSFFIFFFFSFTFYSLVCGCAYNLSFILLYFFFISSFIFYFVSLLFLFSHCVPWRGFLFGYMRKDLLYTCGGCLESQSGLVGKVKNLNFINNWSQKITELKYSFSSTKAFQNPV